MNDILSVKIKENTMREIKQIDLDKISGGEIVSGIPSSDIICVNTKLLVLSAANQPGFDVGAATMALMNMCPADFWDYNMAHEYATTPGGMVPLP